MKASDFRFVPEAIGNVSTFSERKRPLPGDAVNYPLTTAGEKVRENIRSFTEAIR